MRARSVIPVTLLAAFAGAHVVHAQTTAFAGATAGNDLSAYAGLQRGVSRDASDGWAVRGAVAAGRYDYETGGVDVEGSFVQLQAVVLREWFRGPAYAALGVGPRFAETQLEPDDPGNEREGGRFDGVVTAEAAWNGALWRTTAYAEYGVDHATYYTRLVATHRLSGSWRAGVEALAEGDRTYDRLGAGVVAAYGVSAGREIRFSVGAMDRDEDSGVYAAVAWASSF